jgi:hypothetical protein
MRQVHALVVAGLRVVVERECLAGFEFDRAVLELADAQLGALKIGENADRPADFFLDLAQACHQLAHELVARMAHIDAEHVRTGLEQPLDHDLVG